LGKYDIICENEDNSYEIINYELHNCDDHWVYDHINQNESKIEANNIVKYLQISQ
jgi:hypothetical protein